MPDATQRWRRRDWEDGSVVFDKRSGDTHALHPACVALLDASASRLAHDLHHNPAFLQLCKLGLINPAD